MQKNLKLQKQSYIYVLKKAFSVNEQGGIF